MKIAVDADDTLFDYWIGTVTPKVEDEYGVSLQWEEGHTWDNNAVKDFFVGRGESWWDWMQRRDWLWAQCKPFSGAIGCVEDWRKAGHRVELITKKPQWAEWTVYKMLGLWRITFDQVTMVPLDGKKHEHSNASVLIDDSPDNTKDWCAAGRQAILFSRPWNLDTKVYPLSGLVRVESWGQVPVNVEWLNGLMTKPKGKQLCV